MKDNNQYICNDDGFLEEIRAIRNMTDEELKDYIKALKNAEKDG